MIALALAAALAQAQLPSPAPVAGRPRSQATQEIWDSRCASCHGNDGRSRTRKGRQYKAPDFTGARWQKHTTDQEIVEAVANGVRKTRMPAFKDKLSAEEIQSLVPFLRAFARQ